MLLYIQEEIDSSVQQENEEIEEEQTLVARLLHNLISPDPIEQFTILKGCLASSNTHSEFEYPSQI